MASAVANEITESDLRKLVLEMGHIIRRLDEASEYCEYWTMDGEYIPGTIDEHTKVVCG